MNKRFSEKIFSIKLLLLNKIAKFFFKDYRLVWPQLEWWSDREFNKFLVEFDEFSGFNTQRRWMISQLLKLTDNIKGDTAECGSYRGAGSWLICNHIKKNNILEKCHHIFDSFEGLSQPSPEVDGGYWSSGDLKIDQNTVYKNLSMYKDFLYLHKGWIPDRFDNVTEKAFSFVHIDVDLYSPTKDSLEFFYQRMSTGGIILCDDYGFTSCLGATKAFDDFFNDKPEKIIVLDSGGCFIMKL